jgi:hypothetical protein
MADPFNDRTPGLDSPAANAVALTTSDTVDLTNYSRALYVGVAGNVKVDTVGGQTTTFVGVAAGSILPVRVKRVYATLTTAASLVALY